MKQWVILALLVAGLVTTGCLRTLTTITVHADGRAHIVDTMLFAPRFFSMVESFSKLGQDSVDDKGPSLPWSDESIREEGRKFGGGVNLESWNPIEVGTMRGYVATYLASNINWVQLNKDRAKNATGASNSSTDGTAGEEDDDSDDKIVTFTYIDSALTIHNPLPGKDSKKSEKDKPQSKQELLAMLDAMSGFMRGMRMSLRVKVDQPIASTTATYRTNNTLTLMYVDFDKLIDQWEANPSLLMEFDKVKEGDLKSAQKMMAKYPREAITMELKEDVVVKFK